MKKESKLGNKYGYYFINLNEKSNFIGYKLADKLKKKIIKIDINTKEIIHTFESLTEAAKSINRSAGKLC